VCLAVTEHRWRPEQTRYENHRNHHRTHDRLQQEKPGRRRGIRIPS
jgi:hypothetical protein